jgi:type II secretory pathway component PulJ
MSVIIARRQQTKPTPASWYNFSGTTLGESLRGSPRGLSLQGSPRDSKAVLRSLAPRRSFSGFTLIELVLYLALLIILLLGLVYFLIAVTQSRAKATAIGEVDDNGRQVLTTLSRIITSASQINWLASDLNNHPGRLTLITSDGLVELSLDNNDALIVDRSGNRNTITTNSVRVSNLVFKKYDDNTVGLDLAVRYWPQANNTSFNYESSWRSAFRLAF